MISVDPALKDWLEMASYAATILGIPIAILIFWRERRRERIAREEQIYLSPNDQYIAYLKLCFEHPELDIFDLATPAEPVPQNTKREWIAFTILTSIMEQAYLLYRSHPNQRNKQWKGWKDHMRWWMARPHFRRAWDEGLSNQFDTDFVDFVNALPPYEGKPGAFSPAPTVNSVPNSVSTSPPQEQRK